jgi:hypothetical protein
MSMSGTSLRSSERKRSTERVAHGRVRGRPSALTEHRAFVRGACDVPDDQKISGEIHARDDAEFVFELSLGRGG